MPSNWQNSSVCALVVITYLTLYLATFFRGGAAPHAAAFLPVLPQSNLSGAVRCATAAGGAGGAVALPYARDPCPHVRREDLLFLEPFLSDVDFSPEAWPLTKWRLLNFEDTGHCVDLDANAAYLRGLAADYETALPRKKPRKVFGCGLSKTGTTSLNAALRTLRYRNSDMSAGFWAEAIDAEREEPELFVEMDRRAPASDVQNTSLVRAIHSYFDGIRDSATDLPTALFYDELRAAYPSALFVLTMRNATNWWPSAYKQMLPITKSEALQRNRRGAYGHSNSHAHMFLKRRVARAPETRARAVYFRALLARDLAVSL